MNWIGGQRSRMKSKAKTRKQQEFFKKQRLEKTLQKVAPNCPNLGASSDLLKMNMIYKSICFTTDQPTSEIPTVAAGHLNSSPNRHDNFVIDEGEKPNPTHDEAFSYDSSRGANPSENACGASAASEEQPQLPVFEDEEHPPPSTAAVPTGEPDGCPSSSFQSRRTKRGLSHSDIALWAASVSDSMISNPVAVTSGVSVPQSCRLETPVSEETKPSYGGVEQSTEGTWTEELQRRHQTALMKEIKEQILFKPIDHLSLTSALDKDCSEQFPRRRKSLAAKHHTLIDKLGDLSKSSASPPSSGYLQCQRTEPLPLDQAVGQGSTTTNGGTLTSSAPQVVSSKSKFFKVGTPVELFDRRHATGSTVSTPQHAVSSTPTPMQRGTDPSSTWTPTPKTQGILGAEAAQGEETTRTFNQTAVSPDVAATPRHQTACSMTTSALRTPNTHPVSASMSSANWDSEPAQMRAVSEWNNRPCKNFLTLTLNQAKMRHDTILTPCNFSSSAVMSSPTVRPAPHSNPCRKDVLSSSLRQPQGTKLFLTPGKRVSWKPESVWHTPNGSFSRSTSASQRIESEVPREKGVDHAYNQNTILRVASMTPRKGLSLALLSNQNFSPQPNFSSSVRFEQGNTASAMRSPKHTIVEVVPKSPENSTGIDTTPQQLIASKEVEEPTHKSLHHEDSNRAQQSSGFESSNKLTVTAVQESCSVCGRGTAKVDKACQTVPYYATTGTMFGGHMSARA